MIRRIKLKYKCPECGGIYIRTTKGIKTIRSYCAKMGKDVDLQLIGPRG